MKDTLKADIVQAMKARDKDRLLVLRGLLSEIKKDEIDTKTELDEAACIAVVQREVKKRRDAIGFAKQASRAELVAAAESEIAILQAYLGAQLSEDELRSMIAALIEGGAANIGQIMGALNKDNKGKFEGRVASTIAKELLGD